VRRALLVSLAVLGSALATQAQSLEADIAAYRQQKAELASEIQRLDTQILSTDSVKNSESGRDSILQVRNAQDIERRKNELASLNQKLLEQVREIDNLKVKSHSAKNEIHEIELERKAIAASLAAETKSLEAAIANSLPLDLENRLARARALRTDLENGTATAEEGFQRLLALYNEEIRFGDEIVLLKMPITRKNGEVANAQMLRIGNQWMVYMDDDAMRFGVLRRRMDVGKGESHSPSYTYEWDEDLDFTERQQVKTALDVKQARKPPQMVVLPLSLSLEAQ
jgi:hypothetical protein